MWRVLKLLAVAIVGVNALQEFNATTDGGEELSLKAGVARRLGAAPGNIAACYTPFHNGIYPLNGGGTNVEQLRQAIDEDFRIMSQYFTHVRTYYSMHFDIQVAPIAAKYGLKLYLGVFLTNDAWGVQETNAAVDAIKKYSDTVEVILVGNENIVYQDSWVILNKVNELKARAGADAWRVKYGTVQRAAEYINPAFDWKMRPLADALDILGINIYPCFDNGYNGNDPTAMLTWQWNAAAARYPASKLRLTETGYSTGGGPHWLAPRVVPNLDASQRYYEGVVNWSPPGAAGTPKFWFQAFDRRWGDPSAQGIEMELYFGFFTTNKQQKRGGFPRAKGDAGQDVQQPGEVGADSGADVSGCPLEAGVDFLSNDIGSARSPTPKGCFVACELNARCGAFSWTNANGGTCWLKTHKNSVAFNGAVTSGVKCTPTNTNTDTNTNTRCPVEYDVDYIGNDMGNAPAAKVDLCFDLCQRRNGCGAFSWAGNTCYFKTKKEGTKRNGGVHSSTMQCSGPAPAPQQPTTPAPAPAPGPAAACGTLETNVDYIGNDLGRSASSKDAQGCFGLCAGVSGCNAFSWLDGTCYFKSRKASTGRKDRVVSGVRCADAPVDQTNANKLEENVDYAGLDIANRGESNPRECFRHCANRSGCRAFTWTDYMGGTCWLKSGKGAAVGKAKSMSGVIAV